jgi:hypothetical protein
MSLMEVAEYAKKTHGRLNYFETLEGELLDHFESQQHARLH